MVWPGGEKTFTGCRAVTGPGAGSSAKRGEEIGLGIRIQGIRGALFKGAVVEGECGRSQRCKFKNGNGNGNGNGHCRVSALSTCGLCFLWFPPKPNKLGLPDAMG